MKNTLLAGLALLFVAGTASAQGDITDMASADVSLNVVSGITITNGLPINFGNISQGQGAVTLSHTGAITAAGVAYPAGSAGTFTVGGHGGATFGVSAPSASLTNGTGTISFTPSVFGSASNSATAATAATSVVMPESGEYFLFVGGSLNVPDGASIGLYEGAVNVTVTYTSF